MDFDKVMNVNRWQTKRQANKRRSDNQLAVKARNRDEGPAPYYPPERMTGRYVNILINFPWRRGKNTYCLQVDFAPEPHRRDRLVLDGEVVSLTVLLREKMAEFFKGFG